LHKINIILTINCLGTLVDLSEPKVMGILNLTPDSFYDGGKYTQIDQAIIRASKMLDEGATFIDIGGYSSRPGAIDISVEEEERRLIPVIRQLIDTFPDILISVDTFRASIAKKAVEVGAALVNDISAGSLDQEMIKTVGDLSVPYIMMHMRGTPQTMRTLINYEDVTKQVIRYFSEKVTLARKHKINDLIIDPGFGFAKNIEQSFEILENLDMMQMLDLPILAGLSRKSMIYKTLDIAAGSALNGTSAMHMIALSKGSKILRVHDVKEAIECVKLFRKID